MASPDLISHHARALYDADSTLADMAADLGASSTRVLRALAAFDAAHPTQRRPAVVIHTVERDLVAYRCAFALADLIAASPGIGPRACHVSSTVWARWAEHGLTSVEADRVATRLGLHPAQVWQDWDRDELHESGAA